MATFFQAKKKLNPVDGGSGGAGAAYGATMWDGTTNILEPKRIMDSDSDPAPFTGQKPTTPPPAEPPPGPLVEPPPGPRDNPFVNGTATLPTTSTATPGSITPPVQPMIPPVAPIIPPTVVKPTPTPQPQAPTPAAQPAPVAAAGYKPSPRAPTVTNVSQTRGRSDELYNYGKQAMANPSRYDSELMQANAKVIEDAIARMRSTGMRNLGEHYASRGLTGSSLEGFGVGDLEGELGRYANERATGLMTDAAQTFSQDRGQAFGMGMGAAGLGFQGENRESDDAYRNWQGEQGVYSTGRSQDQNELSLLSSIADRFGPEALRELGYEV